MGDMEGKQVSEWQGPLPQNIEPASVFCDRAVKWWNKTVVRRAQANRAKADSEADAELLHNILVVSHGGLLHVLVQGLIESRKIEVGRGVDTGRFRFPNASVSVVEVGVNGKGRLSMFADTTHLNVELVENNVDVVEEE